MFQDVSRCLGMFLDSLWPWSRFPQEKEVLVSTESLCFDYDDPVLQGVDLELRAGRCMGLVGLNASGKTTLARLLRGQLRPKAGTIRFLGDSTVEARSGMKTMALGGVMGDGKERASPTCKCH